MTKSQYISFYAALVLTLTAGLAPVSAQSPDLYAVKQVVDGDLIILENGEEVRLIGIDCPDSGISDKSKNLAERRGVDIKNVASAGKRSKDFLESLINGKSVYLEYDEQIRDKSGRVFAYVFAAYPDYAKYKLGEHVHAFSSKDTTFVFLNATMLKSGYATPLSVTPNVKYASLFKRLFNEAKQKGAGLWEDKGKE